MIDLYTASTPNGHKASIMLEEIGLPYQVRALRLEQLDQKQDWFLAINPNGRIPAIVDRAEGDFAVFESGAILMYLAEKTGKLMPTEARARSRVVQWLMFQMAGVGPMQGQAGVFLKYAPERIEYAIKRYQKETLRLYGVLDAQLARHEYLAGDDYSIADVATFPWVRLHDWVGLDIAGLPHLSAWVQRVAARPAVQRGLAVPQKLDTTDPAQAQEVVARAGKILV